MHTESERTDDVLTAERPETIIWFDGIVEGRRGDDVRMRQLVNELNAVGLVRLHVDVDGGSFSILADDTVIPAERAGEGRRQTFGQRLEAFFAWAAEQGPVESTLRCTEICGDEARETLFTALEGRMRVVARSRPVQAEDRRQAAREEQVEEIFGWRPDLRLSAIILALLLFVAAGVVWQSGMVHRAMAVEAAELERSGGDFGDMLAIAIEQQWGNYQVTLTRGSDYPATIAAVEARLAAAETPAQRAAVNAVANGQEVYCRLLDQDGKLLVTGAVSLRPLLTDDETAEAELMLPGHMHARRILLTIDPGKRKDR